MTTELSPVNRIVRVQIAKDVLQQMDANYLIPFSGSYVRVTASQEFPVADVKTALEKVENCKVCALGAVFVAAVKRYNELQFSSDEQYDFQRGSLGGGWIKRHLQQNYFDYRTLYEMESMFEGEVIGAPVGTDPAVYKDLALAAARFYWKSRRRFETAPERTAYRMRTIMQNIIDNNGEFVWQQIVPAEEQEVVKTD
jgi:hypothetical protein